MIFATMSVAIFQEGQTMTKDNRNAKKLVRLGTARSLTKGSNGNSDEPVIGGRFG